jgi:hypothetical protein
MQNYRQHQKPTQKPCAQQSIHKTHRKKITPTKQGLAQSSKRNERWELSARADRKYYKCQPNSRLRDSVLELIVVFEHLLRLDCKIGYRPSAPHKSFRHQYYLQFSWDLYSQGQ